MIKFTTFISRPIHQAFPHFPNDGMRCSLGATTAEAIKAVTTAPDVEVRANYRGIRTATLTRNDEMGCYLLTSAITGTHCLDIGQTDFRRLTAHWKGFTRAVRQAMEDDAAAAE
jgi:hypothetical protein